MITVWPSRSILDSEEQGYVIHECLACSSGYGVVAVWGKPNPPPAAPCWYCSGEEFVVSLMSTGASGTWWFGQTGEQDAPIRTAA
jgi:hypothetical protein